MDVAEKRRPGRPVDLTLVARREEEILAAATRMFASQGYPNTDLQVLADTLGVGKGTVYRYFPSKEELFLASVDRAMQQLHQYIDGRTSGIDDALERIKEAIRAFLGFFDAHPEMVELLIQERAEFRDRDKPTYVLHREANIEPWHELLKGLINDGRIRDIPVTQITDVLSNLLYGTIFTEHFHRKNVQLEQRTEEIIDIALYGLLTEAERARQALAAPGSGTTTKRPRT
ncbi:MAG TPA: TetR/AcrR family transcriptional regulator [Candidatus Obscuribacterales bacterium]